MNVGSRETAASDLETTDVRLLFRAVNEQIDSLYDERPPQDALADWVCECGDRTCFERIGLTHAEFDAVRRLPDQYAVKVGHVNGEQVVASHERYLVVHEP